MLELSLWIILVMVLVAFLCEYMDSTLGMGFGTTLTPVLLLCGFSVMQIVPAVLFSELMSGILAAICHHRHGNVNLKPRSTDFKEISEQLRAVGYIESLKKNLPLHLKIAILLSICSMVGTVAAVYVAVNIPKFWLKMYIGCLVLTMGIIMLVCLNKEFKFSWKKITLLGLIASFNKGMSGGGYGPVVTGGQILSGVESKSAIGITSFSEGMTCLVGVLLYFFATNKQCDWSLAPWLTLGSVLSVPLSAYSVKLISTRKLKAGIAVLTIVLGIVTIYKTLK